MHALAPAADLETQPGGVPPQPITKFCRLLLDWCLDIHLYPPHSIVYVTSVLSGPTTPGRSAAVQHSAALLPGHCAALDSVQRGFRTWRVQRLAELAGGFFARALEVVFGFFAARLDIGLGDACAYL